ncbi:MAG: MBL fold metallo-hydrolase [Myxococcales bacterium]|nr:MBL fold metallo-hydrolase [Myxococcales bacterium]
MLQPPVSEATDEAFLAALGIHRVAIPVPFPDAGGPVNTCFLENRDGSFTLFDAGLGTPDAEAAFRASAEAAGLSLAKVSRIVVSHGHIDHYGLAQTLSEETGAQVFVHPADWDKVVGDGRWVEQADRYRSYFARLSVPEELIHKMAKLAGSTSRFARRVDEARAQPLSAGQRFEFARFTADVLHMPGHTPGLVCLWLHEQRILLADDHLLARVSPNPLLELGPKGEEDKFPALLTYLASARAAHRLDVEWVVPGHGPPFRGHRALLDSLFEFYSRRQERILSRLAESECSALELVVALFGATDPVRLYLTLSEVVGNLEVLEDAGRVRRRLEAGKYRFSLTS